MKRQKTSVNCLRKFQMMLEGEINKNYYVTEFWNLNKNFLEIEREIKIGESGCDATIINKKWYKYKLKSGQW